MMNKTDEWKQHNTWITWKSKWRSKPNDDSEKRSKNHLPNQIVTFPYVQSLQRCLMFNPCNDDQRRWNLRVFSEEDDGCGFSGKKKTWRTKVKQNERKETKWKRYKMVKRGKWTIFLPKCVIFQFNPCSHGIHVNRTTPQVS